MQSFADMRSHYVKFNLAVDPVTTVNGLCEPGFNVFKRVVIKCNGVVLEDISDYDTLCSFYHRSLYSRSWKNAHQQSGWDYKLDSGKYTVEDAIAPLDMAAFQTNGVPTDVANSVVTIDTVHANLTTDIRTWLAVGDTIRRSDTNAVLGQVVSITNATVFVINANLNATVADNFALRVDQLALCRGSGEKSGPSRDRNNVVNGMNGVSGRQLCMNLPLSGILNANKLINLWHMPLEIELFLNSSGKACMDAQGVNACNSFSISDPRFCCQILTLSQSYVSAYQASLAEMSQSTGLRTHYKTWYVRNLMVPNSANQVFYLRKPVTQCCHIAMGAVNSAYESDGTKDAYDFIKGKDSSTQGIVYVGFSVGSYNYRAWEAVSSTNWDAPENVGAAERKALWLQSISRWEDINEVSDEFNAQNYENHYSNFGINLENDPELQVRSAVPTTMGSDIRLQTKAAPGLTGNGNAGLKYYAMMEYDATAALFSGNQIKVLE